MEFVPRVWCSLALLGVLSMSYVRPIAAQQLLPALPAQSPKDKTIPRLTEEQTIQIATSFCQKMGLAVAPDAGTAKAETLFPDTDPYPLSSSYMHSLWRVIFPRVATVRVDDITGNIAFYSDDLLWGRHLRDTRPITEIKVANKERVMENALVALDAMGLQALGPDEKLVVEQLQVKQNNLPAKVSDTIWNARWLRVFQGLPFRGQNLTMQFDAQSGQLFLLSLNYTATVPNTSVLNISLQEASRLITRHLTNALPQLLRARTDEISKVWAQRFKNQPDPSQGTLIKLEVVQPNGFWQRQGVQEQRDSATLTNSTNQPSARVCWTGRYNVGERSYEVWVDAETGEVVGGIEASSDTM